MMSGPPRTYLHDVELLYQVGAVGGLTDRELLRHFLAGDRASAHRAFEALVHRHGAMVWGVCRRVLRDEHAAEDAFQATFVVLALKAHTIRKRDSVGAWLYGVAARISRRARSLARHSREEPLPSECVDVCAPEPSDLDVETLRSALDEEVDRLPDAYRRAVVLCYLEGRTQEDAARELGWPKGTVSGRLARAKELLRTRLTRRGVAPSAGLLGRVFSEGFASPMLPAALVEGAVRSAVSVALGRGEILAASGTAMAMARSMLRTMLLGKVALAAPVLAILVGFATALAQTGAGRAMTGRNRPGNLRVAIPAHRAEPAAADGTLPPHAIARLGTTRLRHEGSVTSFAFSPDGRTLASTATDGVRFWDLATGEPALGLPTIRAPIGVSSVAYSPDGTKLAIGHYVGMIQFWDLAAGKERFHRKVPNGFVHGLAFAPDGRTFATVTSEDSHVRIWDVDTGQERRALAFKEWAIRGPLAFSADGKRLGLGTTLRSGGEELITIWDLAGGGEPIVIRNAHYTWMGSLAFTPDGTLISAGCDVRRVPDEAQPVTALPRIRIWDPGTGRKLRELDPGPGPGTCEAALSRDGKTLVSAHKDHLLVWELASGKVVRSIPIDAMNSVAGRSWLTISPDGKTIAAERGDNTIRLISLATGKPLFLQDQAHQTAVIRVAMAPDGRLAATGDYQGMVGLWDPASARLVHRFDLGNQNRVESVRFAADGRSLAAAGGYSDLRSDHVQGLVRIWDVPSLRLRHELRLEYTAVFVEFSPDGRWMAACESKAELRKLRRLNGDDVKGDPRNAIAVFDTRTGKKAIELAGHQGHILAIGFAPDGKALASAGGDRLFRFWDLATGRMTREIPIEGHAFAAPHAEVGAKTYIGSTAIATDLKTAVTSGPGSDQLLVWDLGAGRPRRTFDVGRYGQAAVAISPDGRFLAAAMDPPYGIDRDTPILIWDHATKREVLRLEPHARTIWSLAFSADGKTLISGMADTTALVWDVSAAYGRAN
jgi:RNA polymerase sigma factor (sigma-70 family)